MKLILTQEVSGLGGAGDVVQVKDGYGRNYLLPRGLAISWTKGGQKQVDAIQQARASREIRDLDSAKEVKAALENTKVVLAARSGTAGRLFGSVTPADIADAVRGSGGPAIDKRRVEIPHPIKTIGSYRVSIRLHPELTATLDIDVHAA